MKAPLIAITQTVAYLSVGQELLSGRVSVAAPASCGSAKGVCEGGRCRNSRLCTEKRIADLPRRRSQVKYRPFLGDSSEDYERLLGEDLQPSMPEV